MEERDPYEKLIRRAKEVSLLRSTASLLNWDQETMMPASGLGYRSRQLAQLAELAHQMFTDPPLGEWLEACEHDQDGSSDPVSPAAVNVRELRRRYDRARKVPVELVAEMAGTSVLARGEWAEARRHNDFGRFRPWLQKLVELLRRHADCWGWPEDGEPWDALAEDYEPGCTARQIEALFTPLRHRLIDLQRELTARGNGLEPGDVTVKLPINRQEQFVRFVAQQLGFDFSRGRLDQSVHPFCGGTHCHDVRMTTRFTDSGLMEALAATMHETGHGIYNQALPADHIDTPMGHSVSLGIHESQSRLWENHVGRCRAFWVWCLPQLRRFFGSTVEDVSVDAAFSAVNVVRSGFIRVEADEVTYNLHIMIRFELERALVRGDLSVADVPGIWNETYKAYLDLDIPDDARGCLQDIHWSHGAMGYFPTYTLGNLYAAQFFEKARADLPDLDKQFEHGQFDALRAWLNKQIHCHGMRYGAAELCKVVTGEPLSPKPLMRHLERKFRSLYGLAA